MASTASNPRARIKLNAAAFPMSYSKAFSQWWASNGSSAVEAQNAVLSFLPFFPVGKDDKRTARVNLVRLSGKNRVINELEITRGDEPVERNLVMLHGYGAGLGLFYRHVFWFYKKY
jgi:cardiolipin-specific phospholipase